MFPFKLKHHCFLKFNMNDLFLFSTKYFVDSNVYLFCKIIATI